jgi:hypothetical protein
MIALHGVYERHEVVSLNHGVGFDTGAIELILPAYGARLGLKGKIARHWALNPHPTLIPAIESGWVESIHSFGGEPGMDAYTARVRTSSSPGEMVRCVPIGSSVSWPPSTRWTCSSVRRCGWTVMRTPRGDDGRLSGLGGAYRPDRSYPHHRDPARHRPRARFAAVARRSPAFPHAAIRPRPIANPSPPRRDGRRTPAPRRAPTRDSLATATTRRPFERALHHAPATPRPPTPTRSRT